MAEVIRNSGEALVVIINDILDFSKIESGAMELESAPFDLRVLGAQERGPMAMRVSIGRARSAVAASVTRRPAVGWCRTFVDDGKLAQSAQYKAGKRSVKLSVSAIV